MGAACCVAAKSRTISSGSLGDSFQQHAHFSPPWSFRRENRGRVAGEDVSTNWVDHVAGGSRLHVKSDAHVGTAFASEEGSSADIFRTSARQKSFALDGNSENTRLPSSVSSDQVVARDLVEVKEAIECPSAPSPVKLSTDPSVSSLSTSPLSSQIHAVLPTSSSSKLNCSPRHRLLHQLSASQVPEYKSPTSISEGDSSFHPPTWGNDSTRGSIGGSSDSWSIPAFSELANTRKERWSFESDASGFGQDKTTQSIWHSGPPCDLYTCGICMKLLTERSSLRWSRHVTSHEQAVVSVLICGHVYHAECLDKMTTELNKYDPDCPVCVFGEKRVSKMSGRVLKSDLDSKARKRSWKHVDSDLISNLLFHRNKSSGVEGRGPLLNTSLSMKSSHGKPSLRRHFSFGFKTNKPVPENPSIRRKVFSWGRSSKV